MKQGLDTALIVSINPADFKSVIKSGSGIPDAAVFDHNGAYIEYRATDTSCNAGLFGFIPSLHPGGDYNRTGKTTLQAELAKLRTLDGRLFPKPEGNSDFYLLIYWTKWTGKLNKDHVKEWQNLAKANTKSRIRIIEVNLDVQEYWPKEDQDRILGIMVKKQKRKSLPEEALGLHRFQLGYQLGEGFLRIPEEHRALRIVEQQVVDARIARVHASLVYDHVLGPVYL